MPNRLKNLFINRVDLVKEGDNPEAHIALFKSKEALEGGEGGDLGNDISLMAHNEGIMKLFHAFKSIFSTKGDDGTVEFEMKKFLESLPEDQRKGVEEVMTKKNEEVTNLTKSVADLTVKVEELSKSTNTNTDEDVWKGLNPELRKMFEAQQKRAEDAEILAKKLQDDKEIEVYVGKARQFDKLSIKVEELGPVLKRVAQTDAKDYTYLEAVLKAANEAIEKGSLFNSFGTDGDGAPGAYEKAIAMASEMVQKSANGLSASDALTQVWRNNPDLYNQYKAELMGEV